MVTGASNDIQRASEIARKMVTAYGMSERLGSVSFDSGSDEVFIGRSMAQAKTYSEEVAAQIDQEVKAIIDAAYRRCQEVLSAHREQMEAAAAYLLDVDASDPYAQAVAWAVANGITKGATDTTFAPESICQRGQIAVFLYNPPRSPGRWSRPTA